MALPQLCAACREPVAGEGLCAACWSKLSFIAPPYCERLGIPFPFDPGPGVLSMEAIADPPAYAPGARGGAFRRHRPHPGARLEIRRPARSRPDHGPLDGACGPRPHTRRPTLLLPVPLHWRRQWARRFNQSALLAEVIGKASGLPVSHGALRRVKATPQQVGLARAERARNVQGAFAVRPDARIEVAGRRLVLVDDVLTTGATLEACTRALMRAGAASVDVLVFARVVAPARVPI